MAKVELFRFPQDLGGRAPRPGVVYGTLVVSVDTISGNYIVEEINGYTNYQPVTRNNASELNFPYRITQGAISTYAPCEGTTLVQYLANTTFPYATRQTTPNSTFCSLDTTDPNLIYLTVDVYDETLPGTEDGRIEAKAVSVSALKPYKLYSGTTFQNRVFITENTTGIFPNLPPGPYMVTVANNKDTVAYEFVVVGEGKLDEYGVYAQVHTGTEKTLKPVLLQIRKKNYSGAVNEAKMPSRSGVVRLSWKGNNTDWLFSYANGLSLDFAIRGEFLRDWSILYTQDDREYLVELYVDGVMQFRGYLLSEFYEAPYTQFAHNVFLTATDGIGQLKNYPFLKTNGDKYTGSYTIEEIIELCINKVNLGIPIYHRIEWKFGSYPDGDIFSKIKLQADSFYTIFKDKPTCADVMVLILEAFAARMIQVEGEFLIMQPWNPLTSETFTAYSKGVSKVFDRTSLSSCSYDEGGNILNTLTSNLGTYPGVESQIVEETLYPTIGLVKNSNLRDLNLWRKAQVAPSRYETQVKYWDISQVIVGNYFYDTEGGAALRSEYGGERNTPLTAQTGDGMIFQDVRYRENDVKFVTTALGKVKRETSPLTLNPADISFLIYLKIRCAVINSAVAFKIGLTWTAPDGRRYALAEDNKSWVEYSTQMPTRIYQIAQDQQGQDIDVNFETPMLPAVLSVGDTNGDMVLYISEPFIFRLDNKGNIIDGDTLALYRSSSYSDFGGFYSGNALGTQLLNYVFGFREAQLKPLIGGGELIANGPRVYKNAGSYITKEAQVQLRIGTHYYGKNNELFYPFSIRDVATEKAITYWFDKDNNSYELGEILLRELVKARQNIRPFTSATLHGSYKIYQRLLMSVDNNIEYLAQNLTWNVIEEVYTGDFVFASGSYALPFYRLNEDGTLKVQEDGQTLRTFESRTFDETIGTPL